MVMKKKLVIISYFMLIIPIATGTKINKPIINKVEVKEEFYRVKATMYTVDENQTDSTPTETASGFIISETNPKKHRIIAVSHDLKKRFKYGEKVRVEGIGKRSGIYTVRDLMNKRWKKKIDILINPNEKAISYNKAKLYKIKSV
jgi:3D (Asp-Asp-Asp) domain-containing protein